MNMKPTALFVLVAVACGAAPRSAATAAAPGPVVLDNGATVWLLPVAGVKDVAVEAFYEVGFLHEPAGMTQASHLLEHLVCFGATGSFREKESFQRINGIGMANAETLADWTHFDYVVPADQLELVLHVEAQRLSSVRFDESLIRAEAKRCYQETDVVERRPATGMLKHAMMAYSQAWRHGRTSALVRGGLEELSIEQLADFHRAYYRPDRLTLVIAGDFERMRALTSVKKHIGAVATPAVRVPPAIDWTKAPRRHTVQWDASVRGVCIAYPPPEDAGDAAILSLFGIHLMQQLQGDAQLKDVTDFTFCSTHQWKVGPLPFFAYAAAKQGQDLDEAESTLKACIARSLRGSPQVLATVKLLARQLEAQTSSLNRDSIDGQVRQLMHLRQLDRQRALGLVLAQAAINLGTFHRLTGPQRKQTLEQIQNLTNARFQAILETCLDEKRRLITQVVPREQP